MVQITPANIHDLSLLKGLEKEYYGFTLYADKAYIDEEFKMVMRSKNQVEIVTPLKKLRGERLGFFAKTYSSHVSGIRQPIESLFNWINEKTGLQMASKVRSEKGLFVHIFGRLAASVLIMAMNKGF